MELIKNYDLVIDYHPEKANVVTDALSRKSSVILAHIRTTYIVVGSEDSESKLGL